MYTHILGARLSEEMFVTHGVQLSCLDRGSGVSRAGAV